MMRRREFITLLGGAVAAWPFAAVAQQPAVPMVGFFRSSGRDLSMPFVNGFRQGLKEIGFVEGQNVAIEYRWADDHYDRLPALAADLAQRRVAAIIANQPAAVAAKAATTTIPIVFVGGYDPVRLGLVASLNRPGGNVTGVSFVVNELEGKRLGLLRELMPRAAPIGALMNPDTPGSGFEAEALVTAGQTIGQQMRVLNVRTERDIDAAFATFAQMPAGAVYVAGDPFFVDQRDRIVALAARYALPTSYATRDFPEAGGLMSYGTSVTDAYRLAGIYTGRILKGVKPADLPVQQSTKFELVINLKTAKALGLTIPPSILASADEVIE
jgi:putative ABC transport system substrate-binding protein